MAISVSSVSTVATKTVKDLEDQAEKEIAEILSILINRANADNNHPDLELTKLFLKRHEGDNMEKLLAKLGASAAPGAPLGLPAGGTTLGSTAPGGIIYALDESENLIPGTAFRTPELAENAGFTVIVPNPDGTIKGMKKPPAPTPPPPPAPADEVVVIDRKGNSRRIPRSEYDAHTDRYPTVLDRDPATNAVTKVLDKRIYTR